MHEESITKEDTKMELLVDKASTNVVLLLPLLLVCYGTKSTLPISVSK